VSLSSLEKKVATYARRASKIGAFPPSVRVTRDPYWHQDPAGSDRKVLLVDVVVEGDLPSMGEWELIAVLQHRPTGTLIVNNPSSTGVDERELEQYRLQATAVCTHCKLSRRRNQTAVLRHLPCRGKGCPECQALIDDGTIDSKGYARVGRSCLDEYTNGAAKAALYSFDKQQGLRELLESGELDTNASPEWGVDLLRFFAVAYRFGRSYGWANRVWHNAARAERTIPTEVLTFATQLLAAAQTELVANIDKVDDEARLVLSDRAHNLAVLIGEGYTSLEHARIAATALDWYRHHQTESVPLQARIMTAMNGLDGTAALEDRISFTPEALLALLGDGAAVQRILETRQVETGPGPYLGDEGQAGTWTLQVTRTHTWINRDNRERALVAFVDADNREAIWFTSPDTARNLQRDSWYSVRGTVRRQDTNTYRGRETPQTVLTGCRTRLQAAS